MLKQDNIVKASVVFPIFLFLISLSIGCNTRPSATPRANGYCKAKIQFDTLYLNAGSMKEGEEVGLSTWIKNVGDCPWVIDRVEKGCGCVAVDYRKEPVMAGDSLELKIFFNSSGFSGQQLKMVTVFDNSAEGQHDLLLSASVNANEL